MTLQVSISAFGVRIDDLLKETSITLKPSAWENLMAYQDQVSSHLKGRQNFDFVLDEEKDIRVNISIDKNKVFLHIREWLKGSCPSGVTISERDWDELMVPLLT